MYAERWQPFGAFVHKWIQLWDFTRRLYVLNTKYPKQPLECFTDELPPLSWTHCVGCGYCVSHDCMNLLRMCNDVLLSMLTNLTRLDAVSMHVNALNSTLRPLTFTVQGPIKSMATSSQGAMRTSRSGSSP